MVKNMPNANPVLVYHLRQMVRSRVVVTLMLFYLAAMALPLFTGLAAHSVGGPLPLRNWLMFGPASIVETATVTAVFLLLFYYIFTTVTLVGFAITHTAVDRLREHPLFFSPLSAGRLISGKLQFSFVVSFLFLSLTLPFLAAAFLMRGVDIRIVFWTALVYFCLTQLQYFVTVMFYSGGTSITRIVLFTFPWGVCQFLLSVFGLFGAGTVVINQIVYNNDFNILVICGLLFLCFMLTTGVLALVQISPAPANRMLPVRVHLVAAHLGFLAVLWCYVIYGVITAQATWDSLGYINQAHTGFCCLFPYIFLVFICERDFLSDRIRRTIPRSFFGRIFTFPFYTGLAKAQAVCARVFVFELAYIASIWGINTSNFNDYWTNVNALSSGLLFFDYCTTAVLIYNLALHRFFSRQWNWVPVFGFFAVVLLFVIGVEIMHDFFRIGGGLVHDLYDFWFLPNPLWIPEESFIVKQLTLAGVWLFILAVTGAPWMHRRFRAFVRRNRTS